MSESDEEKTGFHTEEGVYCFTHMTMGRKISTATLQRMTDKMIGGQKGHNVEVYLEEIVVKSKNEENLVKDVKKMLDKLQMVNVKIDPRNRNMLHSDREGGPDISPYDNFPKAQSQKWQGERMLHVSDKNKEETFRSREKPQEELIPTPRAWKLYVERETGKEGSGIGMILDSLEGKVYSYDIRLNFYAPEDSMDYEALLAGLVACAGKGMKDLHVFVGSKLLVDQVEGNRILRTKEAKRYREEIMDATTLFYRFRITHLPKALNLKEEALTELVSIKLEFLNQEV
uniref:RNase H type-1 domain-containing protein n=1 Tax=Tanacetum cinerariifolium TaxID=118510 RepID=A0A699IZL5_TANCI|nr:hypothetical protein [Tanacetum cinerariifolium]